MPSLVLIGLVVLKEIKVYDNGYILINKDHLSFRLGCAKTYDFHLAKTDMK